MADEHPSIAVIGGSGFYEFLDEPTAVEVSTPYGDPSAAIAVGEVAGRSVAFLPRHGKGHEFPPHRINYRANLWALRSLGVEQVLAPCAVGGLQPETQPGTLVVPDQLVDRTTARVQTYVDSGAAHAPFADPYCPDLRASLVAAAGEGVVDGGTMVVIEGPRFSTRAESQSYARAGWTVVNMTGHPEAVLARELGLCYATIALVTDLDAGVNSEESVDQAQVFALFEKHIGRLKHLLADVVAGLEPPGGRAGSGGRARSRPCSCAAWLDDVTLPFELPGPAPVSSPSG
jgi:5'-methylthioadenosine phosphorylase